jgi:hypothetical protein
MLNVSRCSGRLSRRRAPDGSLGHRGSVLRWKRPPYVTMGSRSRAGEGQSSAVDRNHKLASIPLTFWSMLMLN